MAAGLLLRQVIAGFKKKARAAILGAVAGLGRVRLIGGKLAINILPEGAPHPLVDTTKLDGLRLSARVRRCRT